MQIDINLFNNYLKQIFSNNIIKIVVSNPKSKQESFKKIIIEKIKDKYYESAYTEKQVFNKHYELSNICEALNSYINNYKQFNFFNENNSYEIKISKKEKIFYNTTKNIKKVVEKLTHNNQKKYYLKEGTEVPPLVDMGVFTKEGKIINSMYDKYKQINKFIEIIDNSVSKQNLKKLNIIDFGCGKSYLTFVVYYYFKIVKQLDVNIVGLDLKQDVIDKCNKSAEKYGYSNLRFYVGDIKDYLADFDVDMVISLHACDTATDYALFNAIKWNAKMIFSVPCCQHEVNYQIQSNNFPIITKYGIAKERISALFTDIIRCNLLKSAGYQVDLLEFVDLSHTPKNLLIRATLSNIPEQIKISSLNEAEQLMKEFNFEQTLHKLLKNN